MQAIEKTTIDHLGNMIEFHSLTEQRTYNLEVYFAALLKYAQRLNFLSDYNFEGWTIEALRETLQDEGVLMAYDEMFTSHETGLVYFKGKSKLTYISVAIDRNYGTFKKSNTEWQYHAHIVEFENFLKGTWNRFSTDNQIEVGSEFEFEYSVKLGKWNINKKCFNTYKTVVILNNSKKKAKKARSKNTSVFIG